MGRIVDTEAEVGSNVSQFNEFARFDPLKFRIMAVFRRFYRYFESEALETLKIS